MACHHAQLCLEPSRFSSLAGYKRAAGQALLTATTGSKKKCLADFDLSTAFPAPLILPGDDLAEDPRYPPQSFNSWLRLPTRNKVTLKQSTIYVAAPPGIDSKMSFLQTWRSPRSANSAEAIASPDIDDVVEYLRAFYHGISVKALSDSFNYVCWPEDDLPPRKKKKKGVVDPFTTTLPTYIGLEAGGSVTRVRMRHLLGKHDRNRSAYAHQLNLNDILDGVLASLPNDAYALILLTEHDIYEDEDDDFCCGRAYGGSRIAVVSSAQYNPCLDQIHCTDYEHCWPASHCKDFVSKQVEQHVELESASGRNNGVNTDQKSEKAIRDIVLKQILTERSLTTRLIPPIKSSLPEGAISAAVQRYHDIIVNGKPRSKQGLRSTYLLRINRTISHELGHCLGMDHCTYYACAMQGAASVDEDSRQPPYLCPVCLNKLAHAVTELNFREGSNSKGTQRFKKEWSAERHHNLLAYCKSKDEAGFGALAAWTAHVLEHDPAQSSVLS